MKLEDITALGIPEEQAKKLLTQHEAELTAEQQKTTDLTEELNTAKKSVADLTDQVKKFDGEDIEGLKKAAADWETKYNANTTPTICSLTRRTIYAVVQAKYRRQNKIHAPRVGSDAAYSTLS